MLYLTEHNYNTYYIDSTIIFSFPHLFKIFYKIRTYTRRYVYNRHSICEITF